MYCNNEPPACRESERGFILVVTLLVVLILVAVGVFALTVSTDDVRISPKLVGERRALSAAESCWHDFTQTFDPDDINTFQMADMTVDATDPKAKCKADAEELLSYPVTVPGMDLSGGVTYRDVLFEITITGIDNLYNARMDFKYGVAYGPVKMTTQY